MYTYDVRTFFCVISVPTFRIFIEFSIHAHADLQQQQNKELCIVNESEFKQSSRRKKYF